MVFFIVGLLCISIPSSATVFEDLSCVPDKIISKKGPSLKEQTSREEQLVQLIHEKINSVRKVHNLKQLTWNEKLAQIAKTHSIDMATRRYFSHDTLPDPKSNDPRKKKPSPGFGWRYKAGNFNEHIETQRIVEKLPNGSIQTKIEYALGAENIFKDPMHILINGVPVYDTLEKIAEDVVEGWMHSKGHRANILTPYWIREGIGVAFAYEDGFEFAYVTQNFC